MFRLDGAEVREKLRRSAERLLQERAEVVTVWLFGSLARDRAAPGSVADLLIVVRDGAGPFPDRSQSLPAYFGSVGIGCDVLVYTESEVDRLVAGGPSLVRTALREGLVLARR